MAFSEIPGQCCVRCWVCLRFAPVVSALAGQALGPVRRRVPDPVCSHDAGGTRVWARMGRGDSAAGGRYGLSVVSLHW